MTTNELRAAAGELVHLHQRFAPLFGRKETVHAIAQSLPPAAWQILQLRAGAKGPLAFAFARVRVWAVRHRKPGLEVFS